MQSPTQPTPAAAPAPDPGLEPSAAQLRIVYNALRALVPETGTVRLRDLLAVTRLDPEPAAAAMCRLGREGPLAVERVADGSEPRWLVRRAADRREADRREASEWPNGRGAPVRQGGHRMSERRPREQSERGLVGACSDGEAASRTER